MFKKKEKNDGTLKSLSKTAANQLSPLEVLVKEIQKDADVVVENLLKSENLLGVDLENDKNDRPLQHQTENSNQLGVVEALMEKLFLDVGKVKKAKYPQATEMESDILNLHARWLKDSGVYRDLYEQVEDVSRMPRIDWGPVFNEKQKAVNVEEYGPNLADVEKQLAAHNILHKEVEAYSSQLCVSSAGSKEKYDELKKQYTNLQENSKWRRHYLNSLYEYMNSCNKELVFLGEEQDKIKKQDWSDRMVDPSDVRRQYENFKNNSLLSHESKVNQLQDDGERLIELKHPASDTIKAHRDAVRNEWQKFLNLCICQETHLDSVEEYKKYQMETEQLSETLTKLSKSVDPNTISKKSTVETSMLLQAEENAVQNSEKLLADLRRRSTTIAPLKLRRNTPNRSITVESLCDWETDKDSVERGEKFSLKSNSDENWAVTSTSGVTKTFPGVCFQIPPPDPEAIDKVDLLGSELTDIKKRRAALAASLKNHKYDASKSQKSAPVSAAPLDPKVKVLSQQLDKLDGDLTSAEESMLSRLRAPLNRSDAPADLTKRLREQEEAARVLKSLEQQKQAAQADLKPLLSKDASSTSAQLPLKLSDANNKHNS